MNPGMNEMIVEPDNSGWVVGSEALRRLSSRPGGGPRSQIRGKQASGQPFLNRGPGTPTPMQTCLRKKSLPQQRAPPSRPPNTHTQRVSRTGLQDNAEEIGFPGSNFSIGRAVLHLHRGEARLRVGRVPSPLGVPAWKAPVCKGHEEMPF